MMKKVAIYCRVAREDDFAIENQRATLIAFAKELGLTNYSVYADNGASGLSTNRPALQALMSDISTGKVAAVLISKLSRLSRDVCEIERLMRLLDKQKIRLITMNGCVDTAKRSGILDSISISLQHAQKPQRRRKNPCR